MKAVSGIQPIEGERVLVIGAAQPEARPPLTAMTIAELLQLEIKPRSMLLGPVLPEKGLLMLFAARGLGKTYLALSMAYAVASGGPLLRWKAPAPRPVLYVDGEMPLVVLQERLARITAGAPATVEVRMFKILAADAFEDGLPNFATVEGQAALEPLLSDVSLVIIDNISTLVSVGRDNDAESWSVVQGWLLRLRRRGISVVLVHHAGKGGQQRGTSRREDVLDTVIALKHPEDYSPVEGARFELHLEKARGVFGDDAEPFEAKLELREGAATWTVRDIADSKMDRVVELTEEGLSLREIASEMGISKSQVDRLKRKAEAQGIQVRRARHDT